MISSSRSGVRLLATAVLAVVSLFATTVAGAAPPEPTYTEPYRPQFHFTPAKNWMNDPNGLIYYAGEYHLFFQHNPEAATWGNISWGHAVSTDLVHWRELPLAIPATKTEMAWSGSVVVDRRNTAGFNQPGQPAMVAVFTSYNRTSGDQTQSLAYSLDRGRTWARYAGNPVLDDADNNFRDPKVFWHAPQRRWVMAIVLAQQRKVAFYTSKDLKVWRHESDFGPANAIGGVWEVPDLFPLPVNGNPRRTKWVLVVNLNPGGVAGGSGAQYFVGDFDGRRFRADRTVDPTPSPGRVLADFEDAGYEGWTTTGTAFGNGPSAGAITGQNAVLGFRGARLANSFTGGDAAVGTLTSPEFRIRRSHLNLLVGGGAGARQPASPDAPQTTVNLVVDGRVVRSATGTGSGGLDWVSWKVSDLRGKTARIQAVDSSTARNGYVLLDHVMQSVSAARSVRERSNWLDYGKDFYAAISFENVPDDKRLMIGWMSNWQYAGVTPTSPWRSAQTLVRELELRGHGKALHLRQRPVSTLKSLRRGPAYTLGDTTLVPGTKPLSGVRGSTLEIRADFRVKTARRFGLQVRTGPNERTVIGYDTKRQELVVDRRRSGRTDFSPSFADDVQRAPLKVSNGRVRLHVYVDESSVEVFANGGRVTVTDQIFPDPGSDGLRLFSTGGRTRLESLKVWRLGSIW